MQSVSAAEIAMAAIQKFSPIPTRRVNQHRATSLFSIRYGTTPEHLRKYPMVCDGLPPVTEIDALAIFSRIGSPAQLQSQAKLQAGLDYRSRLG
ncbi:MAG: hypothetical protein ACLPID_05690 [Beijerinckiaceae bacterium]